MNFNFYCLVLLLVLPTSTAEEDFLFGTFPDSFKWGASSSAYGIEGAFSEDGKGASIWDAFVENPTNIQNGSTGEVACDSYHKYNEDVQLLKNLGANIYRFSLSWSRILPTGKDTVNQLGIDYYKNLISELKKYNITPMVTLYHNDLPEQLQRYGGWLNEDTVQAFKEYARICFREFGSDVKHWLTLNDPWKESVFGYGVGRTAPGEWGPGTYPYIAAHNMIKAHTTAYRLYSSEFKATQNGEVGIALSTRWFEPANENSALDKVSQRLALQAMIDWFAFPIFVNGDYPEFLKDMIFNLTQALTPGRPSRLPAFTEAEIQDNRGSADFMELRVMPAEKVSYKARLCNPPSYMCDSDSIMSEMPANERMNFVQKTLKYVKDRFNATMYIRDYGSGDNTGTLEDGERVMHMRHMIGQVLKAVKEDGCDVRGYYATLLDSFEGIYGYGLKLGLHHVDFINPSRSRTQKASARYFKRIIRDRGFLVGYPSEIAMASGVVPYEDENEMYFGKFPENFIWGVRSSAFSVEGARTSGGKGKSFWDTDTRPVEDIASDQYHHYKEDVQLIKKLGVSQYRFTLSWPRILPDGTLGSLNQVGIDYYRNLTTELINNQIQPMVTIYHSELPQALAEQGGWLNTTMVDRFEEYADLCYQKFGDLVKNWVTIHDPFGEAVYGYGGGMSPPYRRDATGTSAYVAGKNIILAHARAYRKYQQSYKSSQNGQVGIAINFLWGEVKNQYNALDVEATERFLQMSIGWFSNPIMGNGDYPEVMIDKIARKSRDEGKRYSRLPAFSNAEKTLIKGTADFFGVNFDAAAIISNNVNTGNRISYFNDLDVLEEFNQSWVGSGIGWQRVTPFAVRKALNWVKYTYGNPPVYLTDKGLSDKNGSLVDEHRIHYYRTYTNNLLKAINLDGCNVKGFAVGALLDGFEGTSNYTLKFGLYSVNFSDLQRTRTPRGSVIWYSILTKENAFNKGFTQKGGWGTAPQYTDQFYYDKFPDDFVFGTATSSAQIEGAWNEDGKGLSIWDVFANAGRCKEGATPQIACDSYHKYKEDVAILKDLGVHAYRFSISWPRVLPDGTLASRNQKGIDYYNNLINELIANDIEPLITIFHWDLPQALEEHGGWLNKSIAIRFREYAGLLFDEYGDRVKRWLTLNEPWVFTVLGYGNGVFAPGIVDLGFNPYIATHNAILAHAEAYHQYHDVYRGTGKVGITLNIDWSQPKDMYNPLHLEASDSSIQTFLGWYAHPIYVNGDYPPIMKEIIARNSLAQKLNVSRLPEFTAEEKQRINGTSDYFGMNHYTTNRVVNDNPVHVGNEKPNYYLDRGAYTDSDPSWPGSGSSWLKVVPWGIRRILNWVKNHYADQEILITENGVSDNSQTLDDDSRVYFFNHYINEVLKAVRLDGVKVIGYTAWSVMDNFEWQSGYTEYFGIYRVNFTDPNRPRRPKKSAHFIHSVIQDNGFIEGAITDPHAKKMPYEDSYYNGEFPTTFSWGSGTSAYPVEGAWNVDGKGESAMDTFFHRGSGFAPGNATGDVAADSYHRYMEDIEALKAVNAQHYVFSLSWSRLLPDGTDTNINEEGVEYYINLIQELKKNNIKPKVVLYDWDFPANIQYQYNGWLNESNIDLFVNYARVCFSRFGHLVDVWVTINEPQMKAILAYMDGAIPPGKSQTIDDMYRAVHNMIKAHSRVYRMYQKDFKRTQKGMIGIILRRDWNIPKDPRNPADHDAVYRNLEFSFGWVGDPLLKTGDYPELMKKRIGSTRLPAFTLRETELNKGAVDFVGINHYTTTLVRKGDPQESNSNPTYAGDKDAVVSLNEFYPGPDANYFMVRPIGIRMVLRKFKERYGDVPLFISGNGVSETTASRNNMDRVTYVKLYTNEILKAIHLDGVNVMGYTYYPLVDSFSWWFGYAEKKGMFSIDYPSNLTRQSTPVSDYFRQLRNTTSSSPMVTSTTTVEPSVVNPVVETSSSPDRTSSSSPMVTSSSPQCITKIIVQSGNNAHTKSMSNVLYFLLLTIAVFFM